MLIRVTLAAVVLALSVNSQTVEAGRKQFEARCSGCHGLDGAGGEHGASIVDARRPRAGAKDGLRDLVRNGIPDAGMPAFKLADAELNSIVAFVIALRAPAVDHPVVGDVSRGERYFFGKGNCSECHMVRGRGGILGPELSNLARERRLGQIEQALHNPGSAREGTGGRPGPGASSYRSVTVRLRNGKTIRGLVKNESNYDLQLQSLDGKLYLLSKEQIAEELREAKSLMPAVHCTGPELQNLLAYLTRLVADDTNSAVLAGDARIAESLPFSAIVNPHPGDWPTYNGQIGGNRYSPLNEIDIGNVARLAPKWIFTIANSRRLEVTPVVVDGVMYVTTANEAYALDARSGRQIWHYSRPLTKGVIGDAASAINRGVAVLGDRVFMVTDHAHMIALNRTSGQLLWDVEMADYRQHYGGTSAPLVVNDLVLSGTSGGDEGARGFLDAYHVTTGERAWRLWTMPKPGEPLSETWVGRAIEHGCATAWLTGSYDQETNLIYWPIGNPCPDYNGDERAGDNLYSSSVLAIEPAAGKVRWYFQYTPHDLHDWDAVQTPVLVDAPFRGRSRKLLLQANRNGFFYVLDRETGKFLLGEPFVNKLTWATGIGPDGRPQLISGQEPTEKGVKTCPSVVGATNWMSTSYNPGTGLYYVMALESCGVYTKSSAWWEPGKSFYGGGTRRAAGETDQKYVRAIDIQTGKIAWEYPQIGTGGSWGGLLSTSGGLVFFCDDSGAFAAVDAKSGKPLWHFNTSQSWHASPMTYAIDAKQYVAVAAGSNILAFALP